MPESPCIVARLVGPDTPLPSGYLAFFNGTSTSTSSIAAGHDVLGIPDISLIRRLRPRRKQIHFVAACVTSQLGIFCVPIMHRNHRELPPTLPAQYTLHQHYFHAPFVPIRAKWVANIFLEV